jgi:putative ABC transport system permease protein
MTSLCSDLRYAIRSWLKAPVIAQAAITTLACGVGAMTAVFVLVNAVLLEPLPYPHAERLVVLVNSFPGQTSHSPYVSAPRARVWREHASSAGVAVYALGAAVNVMTGSELRQAAGAQATASFFPLFGSRVARGRFFTTEEDRPGQVLAAVISHAWWQQLGGRDDIIGRPLIVNGEPATVVGVLDESFNARSLAPGIVTPPDIWLPLRQEPASRDDANNLLAVARLTQGMSIQAAKEQARAAAEQFRAAFPGELPADATFDVLPLEDVVVGDVRPSLLMLFAAVGLVSVLVSVNVANLLLARASARRREFAVRTALGASRWRLMRQLLLEGCSLSVVGGMAGGFVGVAVVRLLLGQNAIQLPRVGQLGMVDMIDIPMLLLVSVTIAAIGILIGLAPMSAAASTRGSPDVDLRTGLRAGPGRGQRRVQEFLLAGEVAIACVLLIGAVLLVRSFVNLNRVDPGFERAGVVTMQTASGDRRLASSSGTVRVFGNGLRRLAEVPGVESVAVSLTGVPLAQGGALRVEVLGRQENRHYVTSWDLVSPGYFDVFRIRLSGGRLLDESDRSNTTPIAVINEAMARQLWPNENPLGQRILIGQGGGPAFEDPSPREVVGVVTDVRQFGLSRPPRPGVYVPLAQASEAQMAFLNRLSVGATWSVRTASPAMVPVATLHRELLDSTALPAAHTRTMDDVFSAATAPTAQNTWLMTVLSLLALIVAVVGVYAIAAHSAQQRTHELGVRLALGAQISSVRRMVVWETIRIVLVGTAIGVAAATALSALLTALLFGVSGHDPLTFTSVPAVLVAAALGGAYLPARRASAVDPLVVLRE